MKIQFASDLHQEFEQNRIFLNLYPLEPVADYLVLAGDICIINNRNDDVELFFDYLSKNWKQVYIVPGNHENYASGDVAKAFNMDFDIRPNIRYLNHQVITIEGVDLLFTTLWSHCSNHKIQHDIRDFHECLVEGENYKASDHNGFHERAIAWLNDQLLKPKVNPRVVVSHFVPCFEADGYPIPFDERSKMIKEYYTAQLDFKMSTWDIDYWIYGHNHWNKDSQFENINFVSNMMGYVLQEQQRNFKQNKFIEL